MAQTIEPGDSVRYWRPGVAEHGAKGIAAVIDGEGQVRCTDGFRIAGAILYGFRPAVLEDEYQRRRRSYSRGDLWPD